MIGFVCVGLLYFWVIFVFYVLVCSRLVLRFYILVCQFLCLFICVLFRVCLVFILACDLSIRRLFSYFYLLGVLGFRIVLGSVCMMPCLLFKDLFRPCPKILLEKQSINPERICRLLDAREFHVG